jgi:hypothetical protein
MNQKLTSKESSYRSEARHGDAAVFVAEIGDRHDIIDHIFLAPRPKRRQEAIAFQSVEA